MSFQGKWVVSGRENGVGEYPFMRLFVRLYDDAVE